MSEKSPVFRAGEDDQQMEQAALKARQTFRYLWRELAWDRRRIVSGIQMAAVKASFSDPPEMQKKDPNVPSVEHMWLSDVDFDGKNIHGTLLNAPNWLRSIKEGDRLKLSGKQLNDWIYCLADDQVFGGFTIDVFRSRMNPKERKQHDGMWGLDFGKVGIVNVVPPAWFNQKGDTPQNYDQIAKMEHPMSVNMRKSLEETLTKKPDFLTHADANGFTMLHDLALAGSYDGVDVCLNHGADPKKLTANGLSPMTLAKCLGWAKVMSRLEQALGI